MPYFKDATGALHFLDSEYFGHLLPTDCVPITDVEADEILAPAIAQIKAVKWGEIKAERDRRTDAGGYLAAGKWFHSDQKSRSQQLGLVLLGANIPAGLQWKTMDGSFAAMTPALAQQILAAAAASDIAIFAAAETHRAAMEASAEPAAYDFSGGWPAVFEV